MDIRLVVIVILAFIFEIFFLTRDLKFKDQKITFKSVDVEFIEAKSYKIDTKKVKSFLISDKIIQEKNKKIFINPALTLYDSNFTKAIVCKKAILDDTTNIAILEKNIKILYNDKNFFTDMLKYDVKNGVVLDSDFFKIVAKNLNAQGNHLFFDTKKDIVRAKNIKYQLIMEDKK